MPTELNTVLNMLQTACHTSFWLAPNLGCRPGSKNLTMIMNILKIPTAAMNTFKIHYQLAAVGILRIFMIMVRFYFPACTLSWVHASQNESAYGGCARPFPRPLKMGKGRQRQTIKKRGDFFGCVVASQCEGGQSILGSKRKPD